MFYGYRVVGASKPAMLLIISAFQPHALNKLLSTDTG